MRFKHYSQKQHTKHTSTVLIGWHCNGLKIINWFRMKRRLIYLVTCLSLGYLALFTRTDIVLPCLIKTYGGDTLWAVMYYFLLCFISPKTAGAKNLMFALLLSVSVELFQLYQAQWIKEIRANYIGGLLLGHAFKVSDLVCYGLGSVSGFVVDGLFRRTKTGGSVALS